MTSSQGGDLVPTRSSRVRLRNGACATPPPRVEVVHFSAHKRKSRGEAAPEEEEVAAAVEGKREEEVDMRAARYEIMRFGMRRMSRGEAQRTKEKIAVELGAKPERRACVNYKQLQADRKQARAHAQEARRLEEVARRTLGKRSVKKVNRSDVIKRQMGKRRNRGGGGGIIGKYGKPTLSVPKSK